MILPPEQPLFFSVEKLGTQNYSTFGISRFNDSGNTLVYAKVQHNNPEILNSNQNYWIAVGDDANSLLPVNGGQVFSQKSVYFYYLENPSNSNPISALVPENFVVSVGISILDNDLSKVQICKSTYKEGYEILYLTGNIPPLGERSDSPTIRPQITPNPFTNEIALNLSEPSVAPSILRIYHLNGQELHQQYVPEQTTRVTLQTEDLQPGMYFVRYETASGIQTFKIIKLE